VKSADGGRGLIDDRVDTVASGVKRAPDPVRISCVWNVVTPSGPSHFCGGRPTVRKAESRGGNRTPKKRMPAAERKQESEIM